MVIDIDTNGITGWSIATLIASSLTFFLSIRYIYINTVYKRKGITRSAFISALFSLTSVAIVFAYEENSITDISVLFVFRGIQYAFAFNTMLYAFYRNIVRVGGEDKPLVYIGYMWLLVIMGVSLAATLMTKNMRWKYYDSTDLERIYNVITVTMLSSWGFIVIIILLHIRNRQHFSADSESTVVYYILLVLIQAITTTVILYSPLSDNGVHPAVVFFLVDLTMYIAILIAANRSPVWIGDELKERKSDVNTNSGDLEANHGLN